MTTSSGDDILSYTLQAMTASLSAMTSSETRRQHQMFLEQLLSSQECSTILRAVLTMEMDDRIGLKILALSMLHDWVKKWWNSIQPADHMAIRDFCADILRQPVIHSQPSNFRSKLAAILAEIAERQFPQHWPSMTTEFTTIWLASESSIQEVILKTLTFLYTDCTDQEYSNSLPTMRRQEILTGLKASESQLLALLYQFLVLHVQTMLAAAGGGEARQSVHLGLELLRAVTGLAAQESFLDGASPLLQLLTSLLAIPTVQVEAAVCLSTLLHRRITTASIACQYGHVLAGTWERLSMMEDDEERLHFARACLSGVTAFLAGHLPFIIRGGEGNRVLDVLFERAVQLLYWPGRRAALEVLPHWVKILREEEFPQYGNAGMLTQALLQAYYEKTARLTTRDQNSDWFSVDFDDPEDWTEVYAAGRSQVHHLVQAAFHHFPSAVMQFMLDALRFIESNEEQSTASDVVLTTLLTFERYWAALVDNSKVPDQVKNDLISLLDHILAWNPKSPQTMEVKMKIIGQAGILFAGLSQEKIVLLLDYLFSAMNSASSSSLGDNSTTKEVQNLQLEAGKAFEQVLKQTSAMLASNPQLLQSILHQTSRALQEVGRVELQCILQQSLIAVLPALSGSDLIASLCQTALEPAFANLDRLLQGLASLHPNATATSSSSSSSASNELPFTSVMLLEGIQSGAAGLLGEHIQEITQQCRRITTILSRLDPPVIPASLYPTNDASSSSGSEKQKKGNNIQGNEDRDRSRVAALLTAWPITSYWQRFLRKILMLLSLAEDPQWGRHSVSPFLCYGLDNQELKRITAGGDNSSSNTISHPILRFNSEWKEFVQQLYRSLGSGCKTRCAYLLPEMDYYLMKALPMRWNTFTHYHLTFFAHSFLLPYITNLIPGSGSSAMAFMSSVMTYLHQRLAVAWGKSPPPSQGAMHFPWLTTPSEWAALGSILGQAVQWEAGQWVTIEEGRLVDLSKAASDILGHLAAVQGPLTPVSITTSSDSATVELESSKTLRRNYLHSQFLPPHAQTLQPSKAFFSLAELLVDLPQTRVTSPALAAVQGILNSGCIAESEEISVYLVGPFWKVLLHALLQQGPAVSGLEWAYIEALLYLLLLALVGPEAAAATTTSGQPASTASSVSDDNKGGNKANLQQMSDWVNPKSTGSKNKGGGGGKSKQRLVQDALKRWPVETLMSTGLISKEELDNLTNQLGTLVGKRKRQRLLLKDQISVMAERLHGPSQASDSLLRPAAPKIHNLAQPLRPTKGLKERYATPADYTVVDVGGLFDDDPDL
eukprot:gene1006-1092_t